MDDAKLIEQAREWHERGQYLLDASDGLDADGARLVNAGLTVERLTAERNEAQAEATTARIGQHVCETDNGTWRPCPAHLCEASRLLTEHDHHYVKQVQRAMAAEARRDLLAAALDCLLAFARDVDIQAALVQGGVDVRAALAAVAERDA